MYAHAKQTSRQKTKQIPKSDKSKYLRKHKVRGRVAPDRRYNHMRPPETFETPV